MESNPLSALAELLKQPRLMTESQKNRTECNLNEIEKLPSIFHLCNDDRYRVLKLVEELVDTQEEVDRLRQKLEEEKTEFREKRSSLLKKLDLLGEKYEKALADIKLLKERHSHSLAMLEEKISTVSLKFEASVVEIQELRKMNAELREENMTLRKINRDATERVFTVQEENSRLSILAEVNKHKQNELKKQVKKLSSSSHKYSDNKQTASDTSLHSDYPENLNSYNDKGCKGGGGDCVTEKLNFPYELNTIKPPINTGFGESTQSSIAITNNSSSNAIHLINSPRQYSHIPINKELPDTTILENLFFRF